MIKDNTILHTDNNRVDFGSDPINHNDNLLFGLKLLAHTYTKILYIIIIILGNAIGYLCCKAQNYIKLSSILYIVYSKLI